MVAPASSRRLLVRRLNAAYATGLISEQTFSYRIEEVFGARLIDPKRLVGDLRFRARRGSLRDRLSQTVRTVLDRLDAPFADRPHTLPALDWSGDAFELTIGRSPRCDLVLTDPTVSRWHARLIARDGRWVFHDLASRNGSVLNGRSVGRCELRPGDQLLLGDAHLRVD